jgi:hypothetical protein
MKMATPSMIRVEMKRKRFAIHNYTKNCGNCGNPLYEDDNIIYAPVPGLTESAYFHKTYEGCEKASELNGLRMRIHYRKQAKHSG